MTAVDSNSKDAKETKDKDKSPKMVIVKTLATQSEVKVDASKTQEQKHQMIPVGNQRKKIRKVKTKEDLGTVNVISAAKSISCPDAKSSESYKQTTELPTSMKMEFVSDVSAKVTLQTYAERP